MKTFKVLIENFLNNYNSHLTEVSNTFVPSGFVPENSFQKGHVICKWGSDDLILAANTKHQIDAVREEIHTEFLTKINATTITPPPDLPPPNTAITISDDADQKVESEPVPAPVSLDDSEDHEVPSTPIPPSDPAIAIKDPTDQWVQEIIGMVRTVEVQIEVLNRDIDSKADLQAITDVNEKITDINKKLSVTITPPYPQDMQIRELIGKISSINILIDSLQNEMKNIQREISIINEENSNQSLIIEEINQLKNNIRNLITKEEIKSNIDSINSEISKASEMIAKISSESNKKIDDAISLMGEKLHRECSSLSSRISNIETKNNNISSIIIDIQKDILAKKREIKVIDDKYTKITESIQRLSSELADTQKRISEQVSTLFNESIEDKIKELWASELFKTRMRDMFDDLFISEHVISVIKQKDEGIYSLINAFEVANGKAIISSFVNVMYNICKLNIQYVNNDEQKESVIMAILTQQSKTIFGESSSGDVIVRNSIINQDLIKKSVIVSFLLYHFPRLLDQFINSFGDLWLFLSRDYENTQREHVLEKIKKTVFHLAIETAESIIRMAIKLQRVYSVCVLINHVIYKENGLLQANVDIQSKTSSFEDAKSIINKQLREQGADILSVFDFNIIVEVFSRMKLKNVGIIELFKDSNDQEKIRLGHSAPLQVISVLRIIEKIRGSASDIFSEPIIQLFATVSVCKNEWTAISYLLSPRGIVNVNI